MVDFALVVVFVAAFLIGYLRGALRQLITLGAWLVAFLLAAYLRQPIADWLETQTNYSREYLDMLGFAAAFLGLFLLATVVIQVGGRTVDLIARPKLDELLGGVLAVAWAVMFVTSLMIVLGSYYANAPVASTELGVMRDLNTALRESTIGDALHRSAVPGLLSILGPIIPADIRASGG